MDPIKKRQSQRENKQLGNIAKEPFIKDKGTWNEVLPKAEPDLAADRIDPNPKRRTTHETITPARKRFLFLNISDRSILSYLNGENPAWSVSFQNQLEIRDNKVFFENLPVLLKDEKHLVIKKTYFDPGSPTSIYNIHAFLQKKYANIKRSDVTKALRKLEVYQRLKARQLPNKVTGRIEVFKPGYFAADTIYPSYKHGWPKGTIIFTVIDMYSRYSGAFLLSDKNMDTVAKAFEIFVSNFMQLSNVPVRKLLIDKGSELMGLDKVMKKYSKQRPCVFRSLTGQPVNMIENYNAQLQRMSQIYMEAGVVSRYDDILYLVVNAINNQKRKDRMGYTPVELLQMSSAMRNEVNSNYKFRNTMSAEKSPLDEGTLVRVLMLNRKEQISDKTKGFPAHWSKDVYQIEKRRAVIKNPGVFKYFVTSTSPGERLQGSRFRHELLDLKISSLDDIDATIPKINVTKVPEKLYRVEGSGQDALYDPMDDL